MNIHKSEYEAKVTSLVKKKEKSCVTPMLFFYVSCSMCLFYYLSNFHKASVSFITYHRVPHVHASSNK